METEEIYTIYHGSYEPSEKPPFLNISQILVPFSDINEAKRTKYIYLGYERITFNQRHPEYQRILVQEFINS